MPFAPRQCPEGWEGGDRWRPCTCFDWPEQFVDITIPVLVQVPPGKPQSFDVKLTYVWTVKEIR